MEKINKVAIIGAGLCGLYLANKLSEKRVKVYVFEKEKVIGKKKCSSLYSERIFDFIPNIERFIENEINKAYIYFPKKRIKLIFKKKFFVFNREGLENFLFEDSLKKGVKFFLGREVRDIPQGFDRIIGADGSFSVVRKMIYKDGNKLSAILGYEDLKDKSDIVENWPHRKGGFIWRIPRGNSVEYGILGNDWGIEEIFEKFIKSSNIRLKKRFFGVIANDFYVPVREDITLCGEAAGLTKPWSGGGVIWGLKSVDILINNFPDFRKYSRDLKNFFRLKIITSKFITKTVYFLGFNLPYFLPSEIKVDNDFLF